jgi:dihydrofolate reductase
MRKISVFNFISLDGYYAGPGGDISWAKARQGDEQDQEENDFGRKGVGAGNILLFGRITYEMMAGYWPSPAAMKNSPEMAEGMNKAEKIVFSRTLKKTTWNNSRVAGGEMVEAIRKLRREPGKDMTVLGSGSIVTQLAQEGLIDEYQLMIHPVVLGKGSSIFGGISGHLNLDLTGTRSFPSGVVLLSYRPVKN